MSSAPSVPSRRKARPASVTVYVSIRDPFIKQKGEYVSLVLPPEPELIEPNYIADQIQAAIEHLREVPPMQTQIITGARKLRTMPSIDLHALNNNQFSVIGTVAPAAVAGGRRRAVSRGRRSKSRQSRRR